MIAKYTFSIVNNLEALLTDDASVVIYDRHVFIVQATGVGILKCFSLSLTAYKKLVSDIKKFCIINSRCLFFKMFFS